MIDNLIIDAFIPSNASIAIMVIKILYIVIKIVSIAIKIVFIIIASFTYFLFITCYIHENGHVYFLIFKAHADKRNTYAAYKFKNPNVKLITWINGIKLITWINGINGFTFSEKYTEFEINRNKLDTQKLIKNAALAGVKTEILFVSIHNFIFSYNTFLYVGICKYSIGMFVLINILFGIARIGMFLTGKCDKGTDAYFYNNPKEFTYNDADEKDWNSNLRLVLIIHVILTMLGVISLLLSFFHMENLYI